jgi:hypothetical protein
VCFLLLSSSRDTLRIENTYVLKFLYSFLEHIFTITKSGEQLHVTEKIIGRYVHHDGDPPSVEKAESRPSTVIHLPRDSIIQTTANSQRSTKHERIVGVVHFFRMILLAQLVVGINQFLLQHEELLLFWNRVV